MLCCVASTLKARSSSVSVESPGVHKVLFEPSECLSWVWGLILIVILSLLPSCCGFSFALRRGVYFFGGFQHSPVDSCSAASCNFGVPTGEDEGMSFYSAILNVISHDGEFWQNVVHWRRECQTTSAFLPWEPHEHYEKAKG